MIEAIMTRQQRRKQEREQRKQMEQIAKDPYKTILVDDFLGVNWWKKTKIFPSFSIYYNTRDFPGKYAVRLFDGNKPMRLAAVKNTLEEARATIPHDMPAPFHKIPRFPTDDPVLVEVWL